MTDVAAVVCLVAGTFMSLAAAVARALPDLLSRMRAGSQVPGLRAAPAVHRPRARQRGSPGWSPCWSWRGSPAAHGPGLRAHGGPCGLPFQAPARGDTVTDELRDVVARAGEDRPELTTRGGATRAGGAARLTGSYARWEARRHQPPARRRRFRKPRRIP
ncbi:hypothetical protein QJS66_17940 [Kocuria rhizophila]|nr:hypothetical protein QJS66_17940 [Kocuria rhizophila]